MLGAFTRLIRPSFVSGFGALLQKGRPFGDKLLVVNMGIWKGVGALRSERRLWCWFMEDHKKVVGCS